MLTSLHGLEGCWSLKRAIHHTDGPVHRFEGEARFVPSGPKLLMDETGHLDVGQGPPLKATRRYVWEEVGGTIRVLFDDMRPFHSFPLRVARPEAVHLCPPDRYAVAYDFTNWPNWVAVWTVEGPRKGYVSESVFAPA